MRVGSLVLDNDYKHPVVLAKEAATIDLLSDGRLELGLGAGWMKTDYEQSGIPYDRPGVRIDRFEEGLAIIKGLLSDDGPVTFAGKHYTITAHEGTPKPVQKPHPPILIGGGGKRVLSIAGREADIVSVNFDLRSGAVGPEVGPSGTAEATAEKIGWVRDAAGDRFDDIELSVTIFAGMVTDDPQGLAAAMGPGFGITPEQALEMPHVLVGLARPDGRDAAAAARAVRLLLHRDQQWAHAVTRGGRSRRSWPSWRARSAACGTTPSTSARALRRASVTSVSVGP